MNPAFVYVPAYDPGIVFAAPAPGFFVGGAIGWGWGISLGIAFRPWGWGATRFYWGDHYAFIGGARWGRTWYNRGAYAHPYVGGFHRFEGPRGDEHHELIRRSENERNAARMGHAHVEEHHGGRGRGH